MIFMYINNIIKGPRRETLKSSQYNFLYYTTAVVLRIIYT